MKFNFDRDALLKEIAIAQEIIATKTAISILSNVLLIAKDGALTIKATDIKVNFETTVPVEIIEEGKTTVFCDKFMNIISSLPQGEIEVEEKDNKITITSISKKAKFQLKTISDTEFPAFSEPENVDFFEIPTVDFKKMISHTIFAVSDDETRFFMNGVFFQTKNSDLICVTTDGKRLAFIKNTFNLSSKDISGVIIPTKVLSIINKKITENGNISIGITEKNAFFNFANYKFSTTLIDGTFPNYEKVIPENQDKFFEVQKKEFVEAIKRVSLLVEKKLKRIYVKIEPGKLTVSSQEKEIGNAKEEIPCKYNGEEISIAFNYVYLEEPMKYITSERITVEFSDNIHAVTLRPEPSENFFHIIMPMQAE
ncbi:MAG: DNA polymerase III subunit beta [Treponema sp.]|nr:MAG: DNA polymerase III subunit beta [Treponema sp.]